MNSYGLTHVGKVRELNEDAFYYQDTPCGSLENLYVVADGMGGHNGGEVASKMAVDTIFHYVEHTGFHQIYHQTNSQHKTIDLFTEHHQEALSDMTHVSDELILDMSGEILFQAVSEANRKIFNTAVKDGNLYGMGTTVIAATVYKGHLLVAHVGDSRLYVYRHNQLIQITKDHSYVQELVDEGVITEAEAVDHPNRNKITRAVGIDKEINIDIIDYDIQEADQYFVVCSDGLSDMLRQETIEDVLKRESSMREKVTVLRDLTLDAGGVDNITILMMESEGK